MPLVKTGSSETAGLSSGKTLSAALSVPGRMKVGGGANVAYNTPEIRNPLLNLVNFYLPYDRKTLNQWIRYYDRFHPMIGNAIDMHGEFPMSDFHFTELKDKEIIELFEEQKEKANMVEFCYDASREYELIGEVFAFWHFDSDLGMWTDYVVLNPDLLDVQEISWGSQRKQIFSYEPPIELKQLIHTQSDKTQEALDNIDPVVLEAVYNNQRIPLDEFNVTSLIRRASPYDSRGTSIVMRALKDLLYEDKLREVQYAIADQQITPIQLWKLGDPASGYMPTAADLSAFRSILMEGAHDPLFTIVSHAAVACDLIGFTGQLLPVIPEFEFVESRLLTALYTNKAMTSGEGPGLQAGAVVAMKVLQGRYQTKRDKMSRLMSRKLFGALSEHHGLYEITEAELSHRIRRPKKDRKLIIPGIEWNFKLDLTDETQRVNFLMQLRQASDVPLKTLADILDLDYDVMKKSLKEEEGTVFDPIYRASRQGGAAPPAGAPGV